MATDSREVLYVQQSLRAIGMNVGAQDGVADDAFKKGVLDSLTVLLQSLTKNPAAKVTDFSPETKKILETEVAAFLASSDYKKLDALVDNRMDDPILELDVISQKVAGVLRRGGNASIPLIIEKLKADEDPARLSFIYINPQAPAAQRIEKPAGVRANTPGMLSVLENHKKIFATLDSVFKPEVAPTLASAGSFHSPETPKPITTMAAGGAAAGTTTASSGDKPSARPIFVNASTAGGANPFAPVGAVNPLFAMSNGDPADQGQAVSGTSGATAQTVTGGTTTAATTTATTTANPATAAAATTAKPLTTEQAIANVKDVLSIISGKMNQQAEAQFKGMMGISFQVEEPGEAGPAFDAHSQKSLQSVLWALRGPRALDMPLDEENEGDEMWRYSPAVGAEIKRKLPRLLAKMEAKEKVAIEEVLKQSDFFNSLNLLHKEGLLGEKTLLAENPVKISGWLKNIIAWIVPVIMPILSKISPNADQMVNSFLGEKMGLSLADLMPEKFQLRRGGPDKTSPKPGVGDNPDETFVVGGGKKSPEPGAGDKPESDQPTGLDTSAPGGKKPVETTGIDAYPGLLRGHWATPALPQPAAVEVAAVSPGIDSAPLAPWLQAVRDARPEIEQWANAPKAALELKFPDPNSPVNVA